jgi:hypothetical protein
MCTIASVWSVCILLDWLWADIVPVIERLPVDS